MLKPKEQLDELDNLKQSQLKSGGKSFSVHKLINFHLPLVSRRTSSAPACPCIDSSSTAGEESFGF